MAENVKRVREKKLIGDQLATLHRETDAGMVLLEDGGNVETAVQELKNNVASAAQTAQASQVTFDDGDTFQEKLDKGELKGDKGDTGAPGAKGDAGAPGKDGAAGAAGKDGVSPSVTTSTVEGGTKVTITDVSGAHEFTVKNGKDGAAGAPGANGAAGKDGSPGAAGKDGVSPTVSTAPTTGGTKVTITDATGAHEFTVKDGAKGADGSNGANGKDGSPGATGPQGPAGPNEVSTSTATKINGLLKGNGSAVAQAAAGKDYVIPSGSITGNAGTATKLQTPRKINITGGATGSASFDGSGDVSINVTVTAKAVWG